MKIAGSLEDVRRRSRSSEMIKGRVRKGYNQGTAASWFSISEKKSAK